MKSIKKKKSKKSMPRVWDPAERKKILFSNTQFSWECKWVTGITIISCNKQHSSLANGRRCAGNAAHCPPYDTSNMFHYNGSSASLKAAKAKLTKVLLPRNMDYSWHHRGVSAGSANWHQDWEEERIKNVMKSNRENKKGRKGRRGSEGRKGKGREEGRKSKLGQKGG